MVHVKTNLHFYSTTSRVNKQLPDGLIPKGTTGIILSPPNGTWIKWLVEGRVGWGNWNCMETVKNPTG
jgi:hypothetical protein